MSPGAKVSRYRALLAQGVFYDAGLQLANVSVVLPFILSSRGAVWEAGLLYPAFSVGIILGNALSPPMLERSRHLKHYVVAATAVAIAFFVVLDAIVARVDVIVTGVFLVTSLAIGVSTALSNVAYSEVISDKLPASQRPSLMLTHGAVGATIAVMATILIAPLLEARDPIHGHLDILWLGAAGLVTAGIAAVFVGPTTTRPAAALVRGTRETYAAGWAAVRSLPWFRQYMITQLMFVPVGLSTTFYALNAADDHADTSGGLHVLVIFTSIGLVIGSLFWRRIFRSFGARGMFLGSAALAAVGAVICMVTEYEEYWQVPWVHGVVLLLATLANQATFAAGVSWVSSLADQHDRATLLGFGALAGAVGYILLGVTLGVLADAQDPIWAVMVVFVLTLGAAVAARWAPVRV